MAQPKDTQQKKVVIPPATTLVGRQNQMISLAMDESERLIREGKATSQLLSIFVKMGTERDILERERLQEEVRLLKAKTEALEANKNIESLYKEAISAMRTYSGYGDSEEEYDDDY